MRERKGKTHSETRDKEIKRQSKIKKNVKFFFFLKNKNQTKLKGKKKIYIYINKI